MKYSIIFTFGIPLLFLMNACCQVSSSQTATEKLIGKWKAVDSTSFRGRGVEFFPDHQVTLLLADGGKQDGQYEIKENIIIFSIGDAPPFTMKFRLADNNLFLAFPDVQSENKYVKSND
jgi:hypothetical protein